jgi:hypothetical protein
MVAVLLWTLVPLVVLHCWMWQRSRGLLRFQAALDVGLAVIIGPALLLGADLNPVRCLERNRPFVDTVWSDITEFQPTQSDLVLQFHPWWEAAREQLLAGRLPLIADDIGGGLPLLANGQTGLWAPVMLPVWALGPERGTTVMALWKIELAGLGAFLFLWRMWRLRWAAAAAGGLAYAVGAYQVAWLLVPLSWVTAAVPWLWWLTAATLRRRAGWRAVAVLGVACGWLLGSGIHPETAAIAIGSAFLAGLVLHPRRWIRVVAAAAVMVPVALALAWPTLGSIGASSRLEVVRDQRPNLAPVPQGWRGLAARQLVLPMVNGHPGRGDWRAPFPYAPAATGVGGVVLALLAAGSVRRRYRGLLWAALACLGVAAALYLRLPPFDRLLVRLPPVDRMTLPRFAALVPWGLAACAALSFDGALHGRLRSAVWRWSPAVLLAGAAVLFKPWQLAPTDLFLVIVTVVSAAAAALLVRRPSVVTWLVVVELAGYAAGINPVAATADRLPRPELLERLVEVQSAEGGRVMGVDGVLPANLAGRYGLADLRAYDPLRPQPYAAMLRELGQTDPVLGGPLEIAPPKLCGAWSVRFLMAGPDRTVDGWEPVWRGREGTLWRNPAWLPEVRVVGRTETGGWDQLLSGAVDLALVAVVPEGSPNVDADRVGLQLDTITGSKIEVVSDCDGPCLVLAARPWAPGWSAAVDGEPAPLVLANLAGLGVVAPPGRHRVVLDYNPWRWGDGVP